MEEKLHRYFHRWDEGLTFSRYLMIVGLVIFMMNMSVETGILFSFFVLVNGFVYYQLKDVVDRIIQEKKRNGTLVEEE